MRSRTEHWTYRASDFARTLALSQTNKKNPPALTLRARWAHDLSVHCGMVCVCARGTAPLSRMRPPCCVYGLGVQRAQPSRVGDAHVYKDEGEPRGNVKPNNNSYNYTKETKRYDSDGSRHRREVRLSASGGASRNNACRVSAPYKEATRTQVRKWRRLDCPDAERICNPSATR